MTSTTTKGFARFSRLPTLSMALSMSLSVAANGNEIPDIRDVIRAQRNNVHSFSVTSKQASSFDKVALSSGLGRGLVREGPSQLA